MALRLRSFKLQRHERRVRIVPATDARGCPFGGPGVDVIDDEAAELLALAEPLLAGVEALEPGARVRSASVDLERPRILVTLESGGGRPRVVRLDEVSLIERLLDRSQALLGALEEAARAALGRRAG